MCVAGAALLAVASVSGRLLVRAFTTAVRACRVSYRVHTLTPEKIVRGRDPGQTPETPEYISRRIVERSEQICRVLLGEPSETEVEMCALGYGACLDDFLSLIEFVGERHPQSNPVRRLLMGVALRRATDALTHTRRAFLSARDGAHLRKGTEKGPK